VYQRKGEIERQSEYVPEREGLRRKRWWVRERE